MWIDFLDTVVFKTWLDSCQILFVNGSALPLIMVKSNDGKVHVD